MQFNACTDLTLKIYVKFNIQLTPFVPFKTLRYNYKILSPVIFVIKMIMNK